MSNTKNNKKSRVWVVSVATKDLADGPCVWDNLVVRNTIEEATTFIKGLIVEYVETDRCNHVFVEEADRLRLAWNGGTDTVFELVDAWNDIECCSELIDLQSFDTRPDDDSKNIDFPFLSVRLTSSRQG